MKKVKNGNFRNKNDKRQVSNSVKIFDSCLGKIIYGGKRRHRKVFGPFTSSVNS